MREREVERQGSEGSTVGDMERGGGGMEGWGGRGMLHF